MAETNVRKVVASDFEEIYPLLLEFNNPRLTKEDWGRLFVDHCDSKEGYFGYALFNEGRVVGFLGLIFSNRLIDGKVQKFCNLTSWIIKKEYRGQGLSRLLFSEVLKLNGYTIITLPPSPKTLRMHKEQGFKELEDSYRLIFPLPFSCGFSYDCSLVREQEELRNSLNVRELKIYDDHLICKCIHILIKTKQGNCYIIIKRVIRRNLPFADIQYISNLSIFLQYIDCLRIKLVLSSRVCALLIEERFLRGNKIKYSIVRKFLRAKLFRSSLLNKDKITDNLYTESLILDL